MNFFKLYIGDYQRDTAHLSVTEHGAYMLMLQHYYATEKPLPTGKALHRMLRAQDKAEREAIDSVASQFWNETDAGLVNERADEEITKAHAQADTNRAIAQAREAKRKASRNQHEQSTNRATNDQPNHSQTPDLNTNTPLSPLAGGNPDQPETKAEDQPKAKRQRKAKDSTLTQWLADLKAKGEKAILPADPIFETASECGIPPDFVRFAWIAFRDRYAESTKSYADWRAAFRNAVKGNWLKLWWVNPETNAYELTTAGHQVRIALENRNSEAAA